MVVCFCVRGHMLCVCLCVCVCVCVCVRVRAVHAELCEVCVLADVTLSAAEGSARDQTMKVCRTRLDTHVYNI